MSLAVRLGELLGGTVRGIADLGANHGWTLHRAILADGRDVFVKYTADHPEVFAAEAAGLRWLAEAIPHAVAPVLAVDERLLVLPWLPEGTPTPAAAEQLGRDLAELHGHSPESFGAPWPGWIARLPLDNTEIPASRQPAAATAGRGGAPARDTQPWARWFADYRLAPYLPGAARHLGPAGVRLLEQVIDRAETLGGPPEPPARIHGDLWSGNVRWSTDRARFVDPAAHGGHRETDLAMLALFGAPHLSRLLGAYREIRPLADAWQARQALHQLHPLLVHTVLFGGGYREQTLAAARAALSA
ncbi:fructosamine kinase family protein [Nocardia arizonensis]|uniref:fructosamine kinase family protein n=1 Tax=Nocardia arizonensis TaxID=1141647 RepID=UPI0006CF22A4|nr:fructosamine kinase family protein [Nocardia arizonensis]